MQASVRVAARHRNPSGAAFIDPALKIEAPCPIHCAGFIAKWVGNLDAIERPGLWGIKGLRLKAPAARVRPDCGAMNKPGSVNP